jgi:Zn finger protein HypA/HybF involved in hydrogenase expression
MERRFLCKKCWNIFDQPVPDSSSENLEVHCPSCCSADVMEAPPWAPLDSGKNIFDSNEWQYECQQCKYKFKMPIPQSPSEDKNRKCPVCHSEHLHLLTGAKALPLYCS